MSVLLIVHPTDPYSSELLNALAPAALAVVDIGSDESERAEVYDNVVLARASVLRSIGGEPSETLPADRVSIDGLIRAGKAVLGRVDGLVVGANDWWAWQLLQPSALRQLGNHGVTELVVLEAPVSGWERALAVHDLPDTSPVRVAAVSWEPSASASSRRRDAGSDLQRILIDGGFSGPISPIELAAAVDTAREKRRDVLAGTRWKPLAEFLFEGWVVVSDHPETDRTPFHELRDALGDRGETDVEGAMLVRLDDDDMAFAEYAGNARWPTSVRASIDGSGFFDNGRWTEAGRIRCKSGRLRLGHRHHEGAAIIIPSKRDAEWIVETYTESVYGFTVGICLRRDQ